MGESHNLYIKLSMRLWAAIAPQLPLFHKSSVSSQEKILNLLRGDCAALPAGDRKVFPMGDHLPASSQGKSVNLLLRIADRISGRSRGTPDGRLRSSSQRTSNLETVCWGDRESIHGLKAKVGFKPTSFVIL